MKTQSGPSDNPWPTLLAKIIIRGQHKHKITLTIVINTTAPSEKSLVSELKQRFPELKNTTNNRRLNVNHDSSVLVCCKPAPLSRSNGFRSDLLKMINASLLFRSDIRLETLGTVQKSESKTGPSSAAAERPSRSVKQCFSQQ